MRRVTAVLTTVLALRVLAAPASADIYTVNAADDLVDGSGCDAIHCRASTSFRSRVRSHGWSTA